MASACLHEAAHAVVSLAYGWPVATIDVRAPWEQSDCILDRPPFLLDNEAAPAAAVCRVAGVVAERLFLGTPWDVCDGFAHADLNAAKRLAARLYGTDTAARDRFYQRTARRARRILERNSDVLQRLARALAEHRHLDRQQIEQSVVATLRSRRLAE